jgi:hypothetical protein
MTQIQTFSTSRPYSMPYYVPILKKLDWKVALCFAAASVCAYLCFKAWKRTVSIPAWQKELEKGMIISRTATQKIQQLMPKILRNEMDPEIRWVRQGSSIIFKLQTEPGLIFKMDPPGIGREHTYWEGDKPRSATVYATAATEAHFASITEGQKICLENHLDLLVIPRTELLDVEHNNRRYKVLAQEFIVHEADESAQEEIWEKKSLEMGRAVHQLALFIALMNFSAVTRSDMPLIDSTGECRLAVLDFKYREGAQMGFFGDGFLNRIGLVRCLFSEKAIDDVLEVARQHGIQPKLVAIETVKEEVEQDIRRYHEIRLFHEKKGIKEENARAPIVIQDVKALGFDDEVSEIEIRNPAGNWEKKLVTLEDALDQMVLAINEALQKTSEKASIRGKRNILVNLDNYSVLRRYRNCGAPAHNNSLSPSEESRVWLHRVLQALVDNKYIFSFIANPNTGRFYIQA